MKARPNPKDPQAAFLYPDLIDQLNPKDTLLLLAARIPWGRLESEFAPFFAERGRPAKPIRLMVELLILKQLENLSDERVVEEWKRNPYFHAFCGMKKFQWQIPCEPSDFYHFRKRIGEKGGEKIFQISSEIHSNHALESEIVEAITDKRPERAFCDRGFRGRNKIGGTEIVIPGSPPKNITTDYKRKVRPSSDAEAQLKQ